MGAAGAGEAARSIGAHTPRALSAVVSRPTER
jgi:hypothetical protein